MTIATIIIAGFIWAVVLRAIYVAIRNRRDPDSDRRTWSWWLAPLTLVFGFFALAGTTAN